MTRDDTLKLSVAGGLLNTSSLVSTDQTPAIAITLVETALSAAGLSGAPHLPSGFDKSRTPPPAAELDRWRCSYSFSRVFDPTSADEVKRLQDDFAPLGTVGPGGRAAPPNFQLTVQLPGSTRPIDTSASAQPEGRQADEQQAVDGLYYRIATPVMIGVEPSPDALDPSRACHATRLPTVTPLTITVPDSRTRYLARYEAGPFTTTSTSFGFKDGMLADLSIARPSELNALVGIPVKIVNDYMTIVTNLIRFRVDYTNQATALATARGNEAVARVQQQTSLLNAQVQAVQAQIEAAAAAQSTDLNTRLKLLQLEKQLQDLQAQMAATVASAPQ
jgi:hypothetical protein